MNTIAEAYKSAVHKFINIRYFQVLWNVFQDDHFEQNLRGLIKYWSPVMYVHMSADANDIKNNAWVTVNNDFWVTSEAICQ